MIIIFPVWWIAVALLAAVLGGIAFINLFLFHIIQAIFIIVGLILFGYEIYICVRKKNPVFLINGIFSLVFYVFSFQLLFESLCMKNSHNSQIKTVLVFTVITFALAVILRISHESETAIKASVYSAIYNLIIFLIILFFLYIGISGYSKKCYNKYQRDGGMEATVLKDSQIYYEVDYRIGNKITISSYPMGLHIPFGRIKAGNTVYILHGEDYDECEVITENGKAGYIKRDNLYFQD